MGLRLARLDVCHLVCLVQTIIIIITRKSISLSSVCGTYAYLGVDGNTVGWMAGARRVVGSAEQVTAMSSVCDMTVVAQ